MESCCVLARTLVRSYFIRPSITYQRLLHLHSVKRLQSTQHLTDCQPVKEGLQLSDECVKQLQKLGTEDGLLRVIVEGGGCSGFQYKFDLDKSIDSDDVVFEKDGAKVVTDTDSLEFIKGSTVDYSVEMIRSSFRLTDNPQAEQGCSCGASFSVKID